MKLLAKCIFAGLLFATPALAVPNNALGLQYSSSYTFFGRGYEPGFALTYERALNEGISLGLQPRAHFSPAGSDFGLDVDLRFHIIGSALSGLYLAPAVGFQMYQTGGNSAFGTSVGGLIGLSHVFGDIIQLSIASGVMYSVTPVALTGPLIPVRFGIAVAF